MAARQVELVVRRPGQPERRMILGPGITQLGRAEDNDLVLPDIGVSRRHARIVVEDDTIRFDDLGSGNGTFFNGQRVDSQTLSDGDEVVIEPFTLTFRLQEAVSMMGPSLEDDETLRAPPLDALTGAPARLVTLAGHRLASAYALGGAPVALGRSEARDIVLYDPAASRNHAVVELRPEGFWARDYGSANGTYVNGQRITEHPLSPGDVLRIGSTEFRFEALGPLPSAPTGAHSPVVPAPPGGPPPAGPTGAHAPVAQNPMSLSPAAPAPVAAMPPVAIAEPGAPAAHGSDASGSAVSPIVGIVVAVVVFLVVVVIAAGGVVAYTAYQRSAAETARAEAIDAARAAASAPEAAPTEEVQALMDDGRMLLHEGRPLDAASRFYQVLQEEPANQGAKRLGFVSCEHIAFQQLENDILRGTTGPRAQRDAIRGATRLARAAIAGRGDLVEARNAVRTAIVFSPGDKELQQLQLRIRRKLEKASAANEDLPAVREAVASLHADARKAELEGRDSDALEAWAAIAEADPDGLTWQAHDADLALRVAE